MASVKQSAVAPKKSRLARSFAKVLNIRRATGIAPVDGIQKVNSQEKIKDNLNGHHGSKSVSQSFEVQDNEEQLRIRADTEAVLAKMFASVSSIKAAYAQLQMAQCPYDADEIQSSDQVVVSELIVLSELKQSHLKKQFEFSSETAMVQAEIQEQKSLIKTYKITGRKMESKLKLKESEITFLQEKLVDCNKHNRSIEKRLNSSGQLLPDLVNLHLSSLSLTQFIKALRNTTKSIRYFVKMMVNEMESAGWDIDAAVSAIAPGVVYWKLNHKCFAFESFVCREMFDNFHHPNFSIPNNSIPEQKKHFFDKFSELKSIKGTIFLAQNPKSLFARFCMIKYLRMIHPKMELSFFRNLNHRNLVKAGEFLDSPFFASFVEMAKSVWLLHCLAFSFEPVASIFQMSKECRFSEVYMESVVDETLQPPESDPEIAFTVFPGFLIGKTILQCLVYLSKPDINHQKVEN